MLGQINGGEEGIRDGTTLWLFREKLAKAGLIDKLFERLGQHLEAEGYIARAAASGRCHDRADASAAHT